MQQSPTLVLLPLLVLVPAALGQDFTELDWDAESRQLQVRSLIMFDNDIVHVVEDVDAYVVRCCQIQNVSLVITYTGVVVAALMMAGFLYIALNYGRGRSRYLSSISVISRYVSRIIYRSGYGYSYYAEDDYYDGYHYQKRALHHKQGLLIHQ